MERLNPSEVAASGKSATTEQHRLLAKHCCCGHEVLIRAFGNEGDCQRLSRYFSCLSRDSAHSRLCVLGAPFAARHQHHCDSGQPGSPQASRGAGEASEASGGRSCLGRDEFALVAVVEGETGEQRIVGEACYVIDPVCDGQVEAAVSVADAYQRHGLGRALARSLIEAAQANGVMRLAVYVLADNYPALRTFISLGFKAVLWQPGIIKMVLELVQERSVKSTTAQDFSAVKTTAFASPTSGTLEQIASIIPNGYASAAPVSHTDAGKPRGAD